MEAGLSTTSNGKALETGGMFYLNAKQKGKTLQVNPNAKLYVNVPTDQKKAGMQLFEGERLADGSINWINPKPIISPLIPVDIHSLNFYPPNYLDSLTAWGLGTRVSTLRTSFVLLFFV